MPYRTKVRLVDAFRWLGQPRIEWPQWATPELLAESGSALYAYTTNGPVRVNRGDWCICGEKEIYSCTDAEFNQRYEWDHTFKPFTGDPPVADSVGSGD